MYCCGQVPLVWPGSHAVQPGCPSAVPGSAAVGRGIGAGRGTAAVLFKPMQEQSNWNDDLYCNMTPVYQKRHPRGHPPGHPPHLQRCHRRGGSRLFLLPLRSPRLPPWWEAEVLEEEGACTGSRHGDAPAVRSPAPWAQVCCSESVGPTRTLIPSLSSTSPCPHLACDPAVPCVLPAAPRGGCISGWAKGLCLCLAPTLEVG